MLRERLGDRKPQVGLILGSGLGSFADELEDAVSVPFGEVPHVLPSTAPGHAGRLVCGTRAGVSCIVMQGRLHLYEGHPAADATFPVRCMIALGARTLLVTNAAGGMHGDWEPGTFMLIRDHINMMHDHPLRGPNDERLGPRFPDMTRAYDPALRELALRAADEVGVSLQQGVYLASTGPTYETPAEVMMMRGLGADACGMSTVPEVIVARHMGARCLGFSCITNKAAGITGQPLNHAEVMETGARVRSQLTKLLDAVLAELGKQPVSASGDTGDA
ncbi:purine nucleoside phosphorylase I, inosine and guanosine-specific [Haliangium ochraceum DSM 14365]|uniref:Purine nucleoside phosphorylase n=2 Tax=Haliangium ochraceum TaxID=80816 RepID=D0LL71_HALO1|nr:purine nucleoside phosphorylase I, inosine and guanosine-specific [Haliangium ochraceum DSM 14365]